MDPFQIKNVEDISTRIQKAHFVISQLNKRDQTVNNGQLNPNVQIMYITHWASFASEVTINNTFRMQVFVQ